MEVQVCIFLTEAHLELHTAAATRCNLSLAYRYAATATEAQLELHTT